MPVHYFSVQNADNTPHYRQMDFLQHFSYESMFPTLTQLPTNIWFVYVYVLLCRTLCPFLILKSSRWGRDSYLLYFCCVLNAMSLLSFFYSSSRCHGLVLVCVCGIFWSYSITSKNEKKKKQHEFPHFILVNWNAQASSETIRLLRTMAYWWQSNKVWSKISIVECDITMSQSTLYRFACTTVVSLRPWISKWKICPNLHYDLKVLCAMLVLW